MFKLKKKEKNMDFILIELSESKDSLIIPTRLIQRVMAKEKFNELGIQIAHTCCYIWLENESQPLIVNHSLSSLRDKLKAV
jgi:hypothetical protein